MEREREREREREGGSMCLWGAGCEFAAELAEGAKYSKYQKSIRRRQGHAGRDSKNTYQNLKIR